MEKRQKFSIFASMKRFCWIGILVLLVLAACNRPDDASVEMRRATSLPTTVASPELSAIDSLMWHQPDSALARLIPYFDTCCRDAMIASPDDATDIQKRRIQCVSTTYNRHYANLLLSELLYKNDYAQTNRPALLQAVAYFDSLVRQIPPFKGGRGDYPPLKGGARRAGDSKPHSQNTNLSFLTTRAHYINGVGYYENDSIVEACAEYLKALELMENHYDEKDLVGKKAKFMTYTYNRLGDMFSEQFMTEPSIDCYESALVYCRIESTSDYGVSNISCRIGNQYDMIGKKDSALFYYEKAMANLPNFNGVIYRDILSCKTFLSFQLNHDVRTAMDNLYAIVKQTTDDYEKLTRYLTIGDIYFEEKQFDSARVYLEYVFENSDDMTSKIQAVDYLCKIYESSGEQDRLNECLRFLAEHRKSEGQNKVMVSKLEELFKSYLNKKREKQAEGERKKAVKKAKGIIIPIAVAAAFVIIILAKLRSKKLLKEQQREADRKLDETEQHHEEELRKRQDEAEKMIKDKEKRHQRELEEKEKQHTEIIEAERQVHRMEQAAISGRLKRKNEEVRELRDQIKRQDELDVMSKQVELFTDEPICLLILERVKEGKFKSKVDYLDYKDSALSKQQLFDLRVAADLHFDLFTIRLKNAYPQLTNGDLDYCCLYLLGLTNADLAALMQRAYNTVVERDGKLKKVFGNDNPLPITLMGIAKNSLSF